jgi:hypothetical protein
MTDLEDRLRDAFTAVDRQVTVHPRRDVERGRRGPSTRALLAMAAAILVAVVGVTTMSFVRSDPTDVGVAATDVAPRTFDRRAEAVCRYVQTHRREPQFATVDAYRVVAQATLTVITETRARLSSLLPPSDDHGLIERVLADLDGVEDRARNVIDVADLGRTDSLQSAWQPVDEYWDIALGELGEHGATSCAP